MDNTPKGNGVKQTKFKALLAERNISISRLAKDTGINRAILYRKVEGVCDFTYTEIYKICMALGLSDPLAVFIPKEKRK